jgi:hypothetical protein
MQQCVSVLLCVHGHTAVPVLFVLNLNVQLLRMCAFFLVDCFNRNVNSAAVLTMRGEGYYQV